MKVNRVIPPGVFNNDFCIQFDICAWIKHVESNKPCLECIYKYNPSLHQNVSAGVYLSVCLIQCMCHLIEAHSRIYYSAITVYHWHVSTQNTFSFFFK